MHFEEGVKIFSVNIHSDSLNRIFQIGLGLVVFFCDSVGSLVIGIIFGVFTALLTKVTGHVKSKPPHLILQRYCSLFHYYSIIIHYSIL